MLNRWPSRKPWFKKHYLVMDLEYTGLDAESDSIVSIGSVEIIDGRIVLATAAHQLILPNSLLGDDVLQSAAVHGVTDLEREERGISLFRWLQSVCQRTSIDSWVFHHATIDRAFLNKFSERLGLSLPNVEIEDTLVRERKQFPDMLLDSEAQLSLKACRARHGLSAYRAHHALSDALSTAELFLCQAHR